MNTEDLKKLPKPSFENPPLVEVVATFQYENAIGFKTLDIADFWEGFDKNKFPTYEELAPVDPIVSDNSFVIDLSNLPKMRRFWFESKDDNELIQIQRDRFMFNWRRPSKNLEDKNCYPRYEEIIESLFKNYEIFTNILTEKGINNATPSFLELSYINLIDIPDEGLAKIGTVFKDVNWDESARLLPAPNNIQNVCSFKIPDEPLILTSNLSNRQNVHNGKIAFQHQMTVRGPVNEISIESMREWFDVARLWITHGFVDTTTPEMHKVWGIEHE